MVLIERVRTPVRVQRDRNGVQWMAVERCVTAKDETLLEAATGRKHNLRTRFPGLRPILPCALKECAADHRSARFHTGIEVPRNILNVVHRAAIEAEKPPCV